MSQNTVIRVENVSKVFKLPHEKNSTVKSAFIGLMQRRKRSFERQEVLKDISFEVESGDFFGIVGRNGSGKSTLLKMLAGIYVPSTGKIDINGQLTPFIELGVGFNHELTGRENVFLNGALLGFNRSEMQKMYEDIVDFAELEKFMDQKLKNYSSGMQVRLAFSIAIRAKSNILLLDEVLAVGDADFQRKCYDYFMSLKKEKQTVILVTHDMNAVRQYCNKAVMIEKGKIIKEGNAEVVAQEYQKLFSDNKQKNTSSVNSDSWGEGGIEIQKPVIQVSDDTIKVATTYLIEKNLPAPIYGFTLYNSAGVNVLEANTRKEKLKTTAVSVGQAITLTWEFPNILSDGTYTLSVACCDQSATIYYQWLNRASQIKITKMTQTAGIVNPVIIVGEERTV